MASLIPSKAPNLPVATVGYEPKYQDQLNNVFRLYFNTIDNGLAELIRILNFTGPFDTIYANTVQATTVNATTGNITTLNSTTGNIKTANLNTANIQDATISNGDINIADINKLVANVGNITALTSTTINSGTVNAGTVNSDYANILSLAAIFAAIQQLQANTVAAANFQGGNGVFNNLTGSNVNASMFTGSGRQINFPHGAFSDNQDQFVFATDTAYPIRFDTTDFSYGVSISSRTASFTATIDDGTPPGAGTVMTVSAVASGSLIPGMLVTGGSTSANTYIVKQLTGTTGSTGTYQVSVSQERTSASLTGAIQSKIAFTYPGIYNIQFSIQFANPDPAISTVDVWAALGGTYIPATNTRFDIISSHGGSDGHICAALNFFISVDDVNADFFELYWWSNDVDTYMEYKPAGTAPTRPTTPSIILTASFVSAPVPAKTQITPIGVAGYGGVEGVSLLATRAVTGVSGSGSVGTTTVVIT